MKALVCPMSAISRHVSVQWLHLSAHLITDSNPHLLTSHEHNGPQLLTNYLHRIISSTRCLFVGYSCCSFLLRVQGLPPSHLRVIRPKEV